MEGGAAPAPAAASAGGPQLQHASSDQDSMRADPAAFIRFESHESAVTALKQVGYAQADTSACFTSKELVAAVEDALSEEKLAVLDLTSTLPETPHAAYQALTVIAFNAAAASRQDERAVFLIMRTELNTPSLLFGHHWSNVQAFGKEAAAPPTTTPAVFLFHRQRQVEIPSEVFSLGHELAARLVAAQVTQDPSHFCCGICGAALAEQTKSGLRLREMAVTASKSTFLKECIMKRIHAGNFECPVAGGALLEPTRK